MEYIHGQSVAHRDIKPGNLLVRTDHSLALSDFGIADEIDRFASDDTVKSSSGTPAFQPPELANGIDSFSGFKVDVWAAGVTLYNMVSGCYPFEGDSIYALYAAIGRGQYEIPEIILDDLRLTALLKGMLDLDVSARLS
eukprot:UC1_evm1s1511